MCVVADVQGRSLPAPAGASRRSSSSQSRVPSRHMSKMPLFLPPPSESTLSEPPPANVTETETMTRWTSYPSTPLPLHDHHLLCAACARPRHRRELMVYVLVPPLPPGACKSNYMPVEQRSCTRQRQTAAKWKARTGNNSGSMEPMYMLQVAFENNWPGAGSAGPSGKTKAAKETVVVVDDEDDDSEESDKSKILTPLDQALAAAFTHNSTNPNVTASASAPAAVTTWRSVKETRAKASSDSASVEVVIPLPTKPAHVHILCRRVERGDAIRARRTDHTENDDAW
ncbi:hypothetical protein EDB84DRAFT_892537 [Lactarius hengduanensis]|nr:hypothetical protein EDB84DRAFT_892537 [Lactarius hengduanensis]